LLPAPADTPVSAGLKGINQVPAYQHVTFTGLRADNEKRAFDTAFFLLYTPGKLLIRYDHAALKIFIRLLTVIKNQET
jgi:hypothetical protein